MTGVQTCALPISLRLRGQQHHPPHRPCSCGSLLFRRRLCGRLCAGVGLPGLVVTDKDGQRISYTSIRGNNVLSIRVGRFTASLRASLATLRQLRAEGIDTITFQTILCSTTLSVDELLAMGGEDAEAVLTHRFTDSSLTVG